MTKELFISILTVLGLFGAGCADAKMADVQDDDLIVDEDNNNNVDENNNDDEVRVAPFDNDSAAAPAVEQFLSITGTREIELSEQISVVNGDNEDFVVFEFPNNSNPSQRVQVTLDCAVLGDQAAFVRAEIINVESDTQAPGSPVDCGEGTVNVTVLNTETQLVRLFVAGQPEEQTLVDYDLVIEGF